MFSAEIWKISEIFPFLVVKFSIYLNRHVFVMKITTSDSEDHQKYQSGLISHYPIYAKWILLYLALDRFISNSKGDWFLSWELLFIIEIPNSVDPDQMPHSTLFWYCLFFIDARHKWVNNTATGHVKCCPPVPPSLTFCDRPRLSSTEDLTKVL